MMKYESMKRHDVASTSCIQRVHPSVVGQNIEHDADFFAVLFGTTTQTVIIHYPFLLALCVFVMCLQHHRWQFT